MANAGVVGMSEVVVPTSVPSTNSWAGSPALWSLIWVGFATLILVTLHLAIAGRAAR